MDFTANEQLSDADMSCSLLKDRAHTLKGLGIIM